MSTAPRPHTSPSMTSPPKGSRDQRFSLTGTTSVWPISSSDGASGSRPSMDARRLVRPGTGSNLSSSSPGPSRTEASRSALRTSWPDSSRPSLTTPVGDQPTQQVGHLGGRGSSVTAMDRHYGSVAAMHRNRTTAWLTDQPYGRRKRRFTRGRRRIQHRHRGSERTEPGAARRSGAGLHAGAPARHAGGSSSTRRSPIASTPPRRTSTSRPSRTVSSWPHRRGHRPRRRVRPRDRRPDRRDGVVERLVPGVPRRVPVAVRRGAPDRRQAGARRRLGLRRPQPGARTDQPSRRCATPERDKQRDKGSGDQRQGAKGSRPERTGLRDPGLQPAEPEAAERQAQRERPGRAGQGRKGPRREGPRHDRQGRRPGRQGPPRASARSSRAIPSVPG